MAVLEMVSSTAEKIGATAVEVAKKGAELVADAVEKTAETVGEAAEEGAETGKSALEGTKEGIRQKSLEGTSFVKSKLSEIRGMTPEQLRLRVEDMRVQLKSGISLEGGEKSGNLECLSNLDKKKIKLETGWSNEIIENIQNMKQYEILKGAGLKEAEINGRKCLIKENIELDYTDEDGISNRDRIARGLAPIDSKTGKPLELHHLGQKADSPLVELTEEEHRTGEYEKGKKNQSLWHDNTKETEVHGEGNSWDQERKAHWKSRTDEIKE